jgi:ketosteroid isomerase-like protein
LSGDAGNAGNAGNAAIIRGLYLAFSRGDLETVREMLDPEIVWLEAESFPYADGNPYVGPEAVLEGVYARLISEWHGFSEELDSVLDAGDHVLTTGYYTGTYRATGGSVRAEFAHVWTLSDGRVVGFRQYTDTLAFERALNSRDCS